MSDTSLAAILRLLRAQSFVEARIDPGLGAIHGLALREFMFLVQLDQAPGRRARTSRAPFSISPNRALMRSVSARPTGVMYERISSIR
jgi:hypothetical protein